MANLFYATCAARTAALAAAALAVLAPAPAHAQDWKAEWDKTVAAANEEGTVVISSQPNKNARDFIQREWPKAFPKIRLSLSVVPSSQLVARIRTERAAGKYLWDAAFSGASTGYVLSKEGVIDPIASEFILPDLKNPASWGGWDNAYFDLARKYVFATSAFLKSPFYNADHVPAEKVKRLGFKALLDPAYAAKIVWHDPSTPGSGQSYAYVLRRSLGDDGLKKLVVDQKVNFVAGQHEVVEHMARGTAWIGIGPMVTGLMTEYTTAGVKMNVHPFGNTPEVNEMSIGGAALYVYNKRPHPNATRVFVNWLLSKETQGGLAEVMNQNSRRQDLPSVNDEESTPVKGAKYLETQREEFLKDVNAAGKYVTEVRRSMR